VSYLATEFEDFASLLEEDELVEIPVDLDTFINDRYYLGNLKIKTISETQRLIIEQLSQVFKEHTLIKIHGEEIGKQMWSQSVSEIVAMCGKGGGKDFSSRIGFAYAIYKLHCLRDPVEYYGKAHGTYIDLLNIAVNADQAQRVFFSPLTNILKASPFFVEKGFEPRKHTLEFYERPIRIHSGNSEAEAWEGLDLLLVVLDEIAAFKTDQSFQKSNPGAQRLSASGIYHMSKASVMSRFPDVGKVILLSFPRYKDDFICQRYKEAAGESHVLRIKAPTWVMNPFLTRESLEPEFRRNPIEAAQRFGCDPPETLNAYFRDPHRVRQCFKGIWTVIDEGTPEERHILKENSELNPLNTDGTFKEWFKPTDDHMRFIHVDLALKRDRAAICMVHSPGTRKVEVEDGVMENLPVVKMDLIHYWEAGPGQEIDFQNIREFIKLLARKFPVALVTFDRWQSVDTIQILTKRGISCDNHSVKRNDYDTLSTAFYDGRFTGYFHHTLVEDELLRLMVLDNGKIDHPDGMHDDLAQCLAGATWNAIEHADLDSEIDISILGLGDDWESVELAEAKEDDLKKDRRRIVPKTSMYQEYDNAVEINFESV
jgi:hypothetical protein